MEFYKHACTGDSIEWESDGFTVTARIEFDDYQDPPWEREDGHGPVTGWESRDKMPGEMVLNTDRGAKRFYDFAAACKIARRDGWVFLPAPLQTSQDIGGTWTAKSADFEAQSMDINVAIRAVYDKSRATMTPREYAAGAALRDYRVLRAWCDDEWFYCGIVVTVSRNGIDLATESLWGIECNYPDSGNAHLGETARELADEAIDIARENIKELCNG